MNDDEKYQKASKRVHRLKELYEHIAIFIIVNVLLIILNMLFSPNNLWFYWVTIFWGIGLVFDLLSFFVFDNHLGKKWEEKKIKEYMDDDY